MSTVETLLSEIEAFCREAEIAEATFGTRAANDGKFVRRLREGAGVTVGTVENVRAYIAEHRKALRAPAKPVRAAKGQARGIGLSPAAIPGWQGPKRRAASR